MRDWYSNDITKQIEPKQDYFTYLHDHKKDSRTFWTVTDLMTDDFWYEVKVAWEAVLKGDIKAEYAQELLTGIVNAFDDRMEDYINDEYDRYIREEE